MTAVTSPMLLYTPPESPDLFQRRSTIEPRTPDDSGDEFDNASLGQQGGKVNEAAHTRTGNKSEIDHQKQSLFLSLPPELIQRVLEAFGPLDVVALARTALTCRKLRAHVYECPDQSVWRGIHHQMYDDPCKAAAFPHSRSTCEIDWRKRVIDRHFVARILDVWHDDQWDEAVLHHLDLICDTLLDLYLDLPATHAPYSSGPEMDERPHHPYSPRAYNTRILANLLSTPLFVHIYHNHGIQPATPNHPRLRPLEGDRCVPQHSVRRQIVVMSNPKVARLHTLLPAECDENIDEDREWRGLVREIVYTAKNYGVKNDWGPFHEDGTVDWVLMDAIGSVMMCNAQGIVHNPELSDQWHESVVPQSFGVEPTRGWGYSNIERPINLPEDDIWDWAGIEGTWCGSYAFLDYTDWIALNEPRLILMRGRIAQLDLTRYHEAVGDLMRLQLAPDDPTNPSSQAYGLPPLTTNLPTSNFLPAVHFVGTSFQSNAVAHGTPSLGVVRGVVQLTADNPPQVRWTIVIRYGGMDRWRLESVQVGGRGSKRGFFGIWTDALKEEHTPNGPLWYWKN